MQSHENFVLGDFNLKSYNYLCHNNIGHHSSHKSRKTAAAIVLGTFLVLSIRCITHIIPFKSQSSYELVLLFLFHRN